MRRRHNVIAQANPAGFRRIDYLAGQNQLTRSSLTNDPRKQNRSHRRKHTKLNLRLAKTRPIGSDHDVASRDQFTAAAERSAVDNGDCGFRNLLELAKDRVKRVE